MKIRLFQIAALILSLNWALSANALSLIGEGDKEPLLEASKAFVTDVSLDDQQRVQVRTNIAPGYFLYRSKFKISSDTAQFGPLQLPNGTKKQDQFFGEVETYRGALNYTAKITSANSAGPLEVTIRSQGCADVGVCYPPQTETFSVNLDAPVFLASNTLSASNATQATNSLTNPITNSYKVEGQQDSISDAATLSSNSSAPAMSSYNSSESSLSDMLSLDNDNEVLDPEVAFTLDPTFIKNGVIPLKWNVSEGHYLYKKRLSFELITPANASLGTARMSEALWEEDAFFGKSEVFRNSASVELPITLPANVKDAVLKVGYQGCADIGICYPPTYKELALVEIAAVASGNASSNANATNAVLANTTQTEARATNANQTTNAANVQNTAATAVPQNEQDRLADSLKNDSRWITIFTFFGMGLLLTFTPCVLPMVPILSSIIVGSGEKISTSRAFTLSLVYVLAMGLTYTIAGVLIGLSGENISATLQHPYVLTAFAMLFVVLSLSMFGFYEIQLPTFLQNRLTSVSNKQKGGSFGGVATMGFLSALIVGPCVTAPLVGALIYIGQTGDAVLGGAALFALSMGMGLPLLIIGTTFGKYLPRAGAWMDVTKAIFGVMLLGLAIYMLDRVIPMWATMLLSALLLIVVGMFMGAFDSLTSDARGWKRISKGLGYVAIVYGTLLLIGVSMGTGTLLKPIQGMALSSSEGTTDSASEHVAFQRVKSIADLNVQLANAKASNQPVIFDFYADWCISCKEMEAFTFSDKAVAAKMKQAVLLQADVTDNDSVDKALLKEFGIFGPPAIIFYDAQGNQQRNSRVVGYMPADKFSTVLNQVY